MNGRMFTLLSLTLGALIVGLGLGHQEVKATSADSFVVAAAVGDEGTEAGEAPAIKGSDKKGKYWFKKSCKSCHGKDGEGEEVTPISKTIKQWERYFKKDKHQGDEMLSETFDAEQLIHIRTFLINHAADSDQPETCG